MGLKGQLEDLPLVDMLQIIAFSQKSGYLRVAGPKGRGAVVLKGGRVLFAFSWSTMARIREMAREPQEIAETARRENIESAVRELAGLREGSFRFELTEEISDDLGGVNIKPFMIPRGLDAQELLLDLAVQIDSERREATSLVELAFQGNLPVDEPEDSDGEEDEVEAGAVEAGIGGEQEPDVGTKEYARLPPPAESPSNGSSGERGPSRAAAEAEVEAIGETPLREPPSKRSVEHTIVLVDDEPPVTSIVGQELRAKGYRVLTGSSPTAGDNLIRARLREGEAVMLVVDLKMPTSSGRSFFGGFELIRRLKRERVDVPVLLMVESLGDKVRERAKALGIRRIVYKPTLTKPDPELYRADLRDFSETVHGQLERLVADRADTLAGSSDGDAQVQSTATAVGRTDFLSAMTRKLVEPSSTDVSRLVLQVASRFVERGVLFVVKSEGARGLAGFGFGANARECTLLSQKMVLDIVQAPGFKDAVGECRTVRAAPERIGMETSPLPGLGRARASEVVLVPMLYNRVTLLLLYGDNGVSGQPLGDLSDLELFMAQAGTALENKLLQRKLETSDAAASSQEVRP